MHGCKKQQPAPKGSRFYYHSRTDPDRSTPQRSAPATATTPQVIEMIGRKELDAAQVEIEGLKDQILHIEAELAKERTEADRNTNSRK